MGSNGISAVKQNDLGQLAGVRTLAQQGDSQPVTVKD
jgi:hypothetical protein